MSRIITPESLAWDHRASPEELAEYARLKARYESDPEFARLANELHHARMMSGPACADCMRVVDARMPVRTDDPAPANN